MTTHVAPGPLTRWDLFLAVAGRPDGIGLHRLAHSLYREDESEIRKALDQLVEVRLLTREEDRYSLASSKKAQGLMRALSFAIAYDIDYNAYFEPEMYPVLKRAYGFDYFTEDDVGRENLLPEVVGRLMGNDLLLAYTYRPFIGKLIQNPFLDGVCEYLDIRPNRGFFRKKIQLENVIIEKQIAFNSRNSQPIVQARKLLGRQGLARAADAGLGPVGRLIRTAVVPENKAMFDPEATRCYRTAIARMRQRVKEGRRLSMDLIQEYHGAVMANTSHAGLIRSGHVHVPNNPHFKTSHPRDIGKRMAELVEDYEAMKPRHLSDVLALCAFLYNQFLFIHPFEDGNSRTARVILGHLLLEFRIPFDEIPQSYEVRFLQTTKGYRKRNDDDLLDLLKEILLSYYNREELEQARRMQTQ